MRLQALFALTAVAVGSAFMVPAASAQEKYIGEIFMTGATYCPRGTAAANGQLLPIGQYTALFSLLGTNFGGDGRVSFGLPDLRGRFPTSAGLGSGLSDRRTGEKGGVESTTLLTQNLPAHAHLLKAKPGSAGKSRARDDDNKGGEPQPASDGTSYLSPAADATETATSVIGSNQPFSVMNPFLTVQFCVAMEGIYPEKIG